MTVKKINNLREVINYLNKSIPTTLLLDIDDTLIKSKEEDCPNKVFRARMEYGKESGQFKWHKNKFMSNHNPYYREALRDYNYCAANSKWELQEPYAKDLMYFVNYSFINRYCDTFFLTARGTELHKVTKYWLKKLGLYPKHHTPNHSKRYSNFNIERTGIRGNIIYAGGYSKCNLMLKEHFVMSTRIILVDDSYDNIRCFEARYGDNPLIEFIGLHYDPSYIKEEIKTNGGW